MPYPDSSYQTSALLSWWASMAMPMNASTSGRCRASGRDGQRDAVARRVRDRAKSDVRALMRCRDRRGHQREPGTDGDLVERGLH